MLCVVCVICACEPVYIRVSLYNSVCSVTINETQCDK